MQKIDCHRHCSRLSTDLSSLPESNNKLEIEKVLLFGHNGIGKPGFDEITWDWYLKEKDIIIPLACDFNFTQPDITYAEQSLDRGFYGFGEILLGHLGALNKRLNGIKYNDPIPLEIFNLAGQNSAFVLAHANPLFAEDFLSAIKQCHDTTFIWAHMAYDFGQHILPSISQIEKLLLENPNLYFDISFWTTDALCMISHLELLEKYSSRFIFGMDLTKNYESMQNLYYPSYNKVLSQLTLDSQHNIYYNNINTLLSRREKKILGLLH
ncbi:hypothetical protein AN643_01790 [Candidatus Epulonipiscioides saccharophilum]|nr:hypothetical protein AN643_01790 [Epulopiscium sp. SCG-B10WGA-EpuloB]